MCSKNSEKMDKSTLYRLAAAGSDTGSRSESRSTVAGGRLNLHRGRLTPLKFLNLCFSGLESLSSSVSGSFSS